MWLRMKTSADIYCKGFNGIILIPGVLSLVFLSGCATTKQVAPSVSEVTASPEQKSEVRTSEATRAGTLSEYEEVKGEKKSCMASWYGREFHGKPTASGENFNMFALTCAHRDYPLGTKIKITNSSNNKEIECIVNDRGPFVEGRDVDLSYAAAKRIGLIGPGVARVDIEPLGRYTRYVKDVRYGRLDGAMVTIQVGSFRDEANARRLKKGLEIHYKDIYIMHADVGRERYHRVRLGKFKDSSDALKVANTLAQEGYSVLITKYEQQI